MHKVAIRTMIQTFLSTIPTKLKPKFGIVVRHVTGMALWVEETKRANLIKARQKKNKRRKRSA